MSPLARVLTALVLAGLALSASAQVYKWKDAKGVTHYGDAPPARVKATAVRTAPAPKAPAAPTGTPAAAAAPGGAGAQSAQCTTARKNLGLLQGSAPVGVDANGDGKPEATMDATQRAAQAKLAQAGIDAYCTGPAATAPKA